MFRGVDFEFTFGLCCLLLSIWGFVQLIIMGIFFKMEALVLIEEAEPDEDTYEDFDDFMKQTKDNFKKIAVNCWIAAVIYLITLCLSYMCLKQASNQKRIEAEKLKDDELFCRALAKKF